MLFSEDTVAQIKNGGVGVIPTDTVYGLIASAENPVAVKRLYNLKNREGKPGTIIAASVDQLVGLGLKRRYLKAVEQYWPAAVSVIIPCGPELEYLHEGKNSLAVRVPEPKDLRDFLERTGPLLTSSANHPSESPADTIVEARNYFGNKPDFYVDGGNLSGHQPSTVIGIIDDAIEVIRQGAVIIRENE